MANEQNLRPWQKGQSGNPQGPAKPFTDALIRALGCAEVDGGPTNAEQIVQTCIRLAKEGDGKALKILGMLLDRAEGPVKQATSIDLSGTISLVPWNDETVT